jgi:hypothetical protein
MYVIEISENDQEVDRALVDITLPMTLTSKYREILERDVCAARKLVITC